MFIHRFLSLDWLQGCYSPFSILNGWKPMFSDKFSQIHSVVFYPFSTIVYTLVLRVLVFSYCRMHCGVKRSTRVFSDVAYVQPIHSVCTLVSGIISLKKALVFTQVFGRSLRVFDSFLICVFTFELHSESSADMLRFSGLVLVFMKLLIYKVLSKTCLYILHSLINNL